MKPSLPSSRPLSALFRRGRKLFAGILLAATLGAFVFSVGFVLHAAGHDCSGHDCPVCAFVAVCEANLQQLGSGYAPAPLAVAAAAVVWPQDFPAPGARILVQGVFDTYEEKDQRFVHLRDAVLLFKR